MRGATAVVLTLLLTLPVAGQPGRAGEGGGRFQATAIPGHDGQPPSVILLDTVTGQSWILVRTPGPPVQWAPLRFWSGGNPPVLSALPPGPEVVGNRPAGTDGAAR